MVFVVGAIRLWQRSAFLFSR